MFVKLLKIFKNRNNIQPTEAMETLVSVMKKISVKSLSDQSTAKWWNKKLKQTRTRTRKVHKNVQKSQNKRADVSIKTDFKSL